MLLRETTNVANTTAVTFNTSGNYNPKYGKQKVYVSGRGGTGTTVPGNYFDNSYTNAGTYVPGGVTPGYTNPPTIVPPSPGTIGSVTYNVSSPVILSYAGSPAAFYQYGSGYTTYSATVYNSPSFGTPAYAYSSTAESYFGPMSGSMGSPFYLGALTNYNTISGTIPGYTTPGTANSPVPYNATYTPGNFVAGNSGTYATNYTTGTAANILGVTFPGGVGGAATVVPATLITNPKYGTTTTVTIPSGGYATITFTL